MRRHTGFSKSESGQALVWALILMAIGIVLLVPVLSLAGTSLRAAQIHEAKTLEFYAADAGMQDALSRIRLDDSEGGFELPQGFGDQVSYTLDEEINGRQVDVTIETVWLLNDMESAEYGMMPHQELAVIQNVAGMEGSGGTYNVELSYDGSAGLLKIERVAVWLPPGFSYVAGSASGITTDEPDQVSVRGGTTLMWDFQPKVKFEDLALPGDPGGGFTPGTEYPAVRQLTFDFTPAQNPGGAFAWIRTNRSDIYLSWDVESAAYKVTVTATDLDTGRQATAEAYVSKGMLDDRVVPVYGDYRVLGNSLMVDTDHDATGIRDTLLSQSSATIEKHAVFDESELPADAQIELAYLFWSAWWEDEDADTEVTLQVNGGDVNEVDAGKWWILPNKPGSYAYSGKADVTSLLSEISAGGDGSSYTITVGGVDAVTDDDWSYAGWSLVLIYSSPSESARQLYLYDDFLYADEDTSHTIAIEGFQAPDEWEDSTGRLTYFVGEGDDGYIGDSVEVNGSYLSDVVNPWDNVMNGQSSGLGGGLIDGVDIDTFDVSAYILAGDTSAEIELSTGIDSWNLGYIILSFRSEVAEDWQPRALGIVSYNYE